MNSEYEPKSSEMSDLALSDLALARGIIADTFDLEHRPRQIVIGLTIAALKRVERALPPEIMRDRRRVWTERRVRSIVDEEARRIEHYEIDDLTKMKLAEARLEFQRSTTRAAQLAEFLACRDADFHSPEIEFQNDVARGGVARGMDCAGDQGASHEEDRGRAADHGERQQARGVARPGNYGHRAGGATR